jgi:omega-amidase
MRVSCIQLDLRWEDQEVNYLRGRRLIREAAEGGADLVCLPELFSTGVTPNSGVFAESPDGATCDFLRQEARENDVYLAGSYIEENDGRLPYNSSIVFDPRGRIVSRYHKSHLFTYGGEDASYYPGDGRLMTFKIRGFTASPFICYDLRFPELFRGAIDLGADLLIVQANWPKERMRSWEVLLQARAIENLAYVVGVNQVGSSPRNTFLGASMIVGPRGDVLAKARGREKVLSADLDMGSLKRHRRQFPALSDRRKRH